MSLGVASLFASSLLGASPTAGVGGAPINATSTAETGDVSQHFGGFGDFNVAGRDAGAGAGVPWFVWAGAGLLALLFVLRRR